MCFDRRRVRYGLFRPYGWRITESPDAPAPRPQTAANRGRPRAQKGGNVGNMHSDNIDVLGERHRPPAANRYRDSSRLLP